MSTVTNILVNDKFWKLPTSIIFLDRETRDKDIYPKPAHIYLFIFLSHWYWIYSFLSLILNIVWVCMIPYMCITNVNVFWQICYYFQNLFQFMCNRKGHLQGKRYKMLWWWLVFNDDSSSGNYSLTLIFSLFFPLQFSGEKLHCPERSFVTMWFARPYLTFLNAAIAYPSSLTSLFSFFRGSTQLLIPFILPRLISFCPSTKYCTLWDCFLPKNNCCLPLSDSTWILVLG